MKQLNTLKRYYVNVKFEKYGTYTIEARSKEHALEIYAENEEDARLQFQNGNYQYYDISDFTDGYELIEVKEVKIDG